ncbi:Lipoprotein [Bacillus cereus]|nr:lipoprotein [Bacillus wiedmannii]SCC67932.1 Lipoprotein [Bacillus cereus]
MEQGEVDKIRIVQYTHEGDPIFQTVEHSENDILYVLDNRKDQFAGEHKGLHKDSCKSIVKEQGELEITYRLIDCVNENGRNGYDLLYVPKK